MTRNSLFAGLTILLTGLFVVFGLLPFTSVLVLLGLIFYFPVILMLNRLKAGDSLKHKKKVMGIVIMESFLIFTLLGISLALGVV